MNPEEIKVGETYNVRVKVEEKTERNTIRGVTILPNGKKLARCVFFDYEIAAFFPIDFTPSEASHAGASAQAGKYDPCRKFRAGDIVEPCSVKGRWQSPAWEGRSGIRFIVATDEDKDGTMWVKDPDSVMDRYTNAVYFQLVTPVEAQAPYSVHEGNNEGEWCVYRDWGIETQKLVALFYPTYPNAKAAAETECSSLNAAYRKELMK